MFNLESAIAGWRGQMLAAGITILALDELENHLREEIAQQLDAGLSAAEAFPSAVRKIGAARRLKAEFIKAASASEPINYKLARWVLVCAAAAYCWVMYFAVRALLFDEMSWSLRLLGLSAVVLSVAAIFGGRQISRLLPALADRRIRFIVQIGCFVPVIIWFPVFANVILPRMDYEHFDRSLFMVSALWTLASLPISFSFWKGFSDAAAGKPSSAI